MNRCKLCHGWADRVWLYDHNGYCPRCNLVVHTTSLTESCNPEMETESQAQESKILGSRQLYSVVQDREEPHTILIKWGDNHILSVDNLPANTVLEFRDYDVEGAPAGYVDQDENGIPCKISRVGNQWRLDHARG